MQMWTKWAGLPADPPFSEQGLRETLDGGQIFRFNEVDGVFEGVWGSYVARVRLTSSGGVEWSAPVGHIDGLPMALEQLLGLDRDYRMINDHLPWRSDPALLKCMAAYPGLRIIGQPFEDALIGFLCSSTKRIRQIKEMMSLLAERHGQAIAAGYHRLPTWQELYDAGEEKLRACKLGYRARYLHQTAKFLLEHPNHLEEVRAMPYPVARRALVELPGVGIKIADCALLYGAGRLESFPVDTWIGQALEGYYGMEGWKLEQLAQFGRLHFGDHAGLAQQYLFAYARNGLRGKSA